MSRLLAAYCRFSSNNQREESIDAQLRAIKHYAEVNGDTIVKVYIDKAESGTSDKREKFQEMISDSELGIFEYVVVHKLDRFARNKYHSVTYKRKLKLNGVQVLSVTENIDGSPESLILESLLEGMSEYYSQNLAREVMKGMTENALKAMHCGGTAPLGYDVNPATKKYVINEEEAKIVKIIFEKYLDSWGHKQICDYLNGMGYKTKRGNTFGKNSIHSILKNQKYEGTYVFNRTASKNLLGKRNHHKSKKDEEIIKVEDGVPAIISKDDFQRVQEILYNNKKISGSFKAKENYLVSGIIWCGECGSRMYGNSRISGRNKQRYVTYRCSIKDKTHACDNKEINKEYLDNYVLDELHKNLFNDDAIPLLVEMLNDYQQESNEKNKKEAEELKKQQREVEKQIDNIVKAITSGLDMSPLKDKLEELEKEKIEVEIKIQKIEAKEQRKVIDEVIVRKILQMSKDFIIEKNIAECKKIISNYVKKVVVYKEYVEVVFNLNIGNQILMNDDSSIFQIQKRTESIYNHYKVV